jgi:hypothetical protein
MPTAPFVQLVPCYLFGCTYGFSWRLAGID